MFNKIEFSDLYKFLTSAGLFIMAAALIIPWLFVKQNNGLLISEQEFKNLIESSKTIAEQRIVLSSWIFNLIKPFSISLFLIGVISFCIGIYKWWIKQRSVDQTDYYNLLELHSKVKYLLPKEIEEKATKEVKEELLGNIYGKNVVVENSIKSSESPVETSTTTINEMKARLISIEELLFKKIQAYNPFEYMPKSNVDIGEDFHIDILLESYEIRKRHDILIDIKYLQSSLKMDFIRSSYVNFMKARANYFNKFRRNTKTIYIVIYNNRIADNEQTNRFISAFTEFQNDRKSTSTKIVLLADTEVGTFDVSILFK